MDDKYSIKWNYFNTELVTTAGLLFQIETGNYLVIEKIAFKGGKWSGVEISDPNSSNIIIQDLEISDCGGGLALAGKNITARRNYIHDGKMVVNTQGAPGTPDADNDYGATRIGLGMIDGCQIYDNRLVNLRAKSYDYRFDGGALEFWRSVRNCEIYRNYSYNTDGFSEFGGIAGDSMVNISIHHNVAFEAGNFACFHVYSPGASYGVSYKWVKADNNLSVTKLRNPGFFFVTDGARLPDSNQIVIRNNIFASDSLSGFFYEGVSPRNKSSYVHRNNLVWCAAKNPFASGGQIPGFKSL